MAERIDEVLAAMSRLIARSRLLREEFDRIIEEYDHLQKELHQLQKGGTEPPRK